MTRPGLIAAASEVHLSRREKSTEFAEESDFNQTPFRYGGLVIRGLPHERTPEKQIAQKKKPPEGGSQFCSDGVTPVRT